MRRAAFLLIIILCLPLLTGCGSVYANYREVEQILAVQTMGLDRQPGGVLLSLAAPSAASRDGKPVYLSGTGESISLAMERLRNWSSEEDIFPAHINHLVLGEDTARQGIGFCLNYLCRSPEMRIDTPLYVVKDCRAYDMISGVIGSGTGICEVLQSVKTNADERSDSYVFTAGQALSALERYGSCLLCALEYSESDEVSGGSGESSGGSQEQSGEGGGSMTAAVSGYAVIKDGKLCAFIDRDRAAGASYMMNLAAATRMGVHDREGHAVTLDVSEGSTELRPVWTGSGELKGLNIAAKVTASILEMDTEPPAGSEEEFEDYITAQLENAVSERISAVLRLSRRLDADFLGLAGRVEMADPVKFRNMPQDFIQVLPELELRVSVSGTLNHTNNLKDA